MQKWTSRTQCKPCSDPARRFGAVLSKGNSGNMQRKTAPANRPTPPRSLVCSMFDRIAPTYNLLNHVLSFGCDFYWRRKLAASLDKNRPLELLDLATGTGDVLISLLRTNPNITKAIGLDISANMLALCRRRIADSGLESRVSLIRADATRTGLPDRSFDVVTIAFGIRNVPDPAETLAEIHRLLRPGGTLLILEFSLPPNRIIRTLYLPYLRYIVPLLGRLVSRDKAAYRYLNTTIENFERTCDLPALMHRAAFTNITTTPMTFATVCLYSASKP